MAPQAAGHLKCFRSLMEFNHDYSYLLLHNNVFHTCHLTIGLQSCLKPEKLAEYLELIQWGVNNLHNKTNNIRDYKTLEKILNGTVLHVFLSVAFSKLSPFLFCFIFCKTDVSVPIHPRRKYFFQSYTVNATSRKILWIAHIVEKIVRQMENIHLNLNK